MQERKTALGFEKSMKKIIEFQADNDLKPDGIIGRKTITKFKEKFELNNYEVAHFLGQLHHETGGFNFDTESLNYSPQGLRNTFSYYRKHPLEALQDGRTLISKANQEKIANKVYWDKNRSKGYELGNVIWGQGWLFIGRGAIQLTGYNNYFRFHKWMNNMEIILCPQTVAKKYYWESALFFFHENRLWNLCTTISTTQINKVTAKINRSTNSYKERVELVRNYYEIAKQTAL